MKNICSQYRLIETQVLLTTIAVFLCFHSLAQVSPYQIPPKWMFGYKAGFDFGTSPYTISPPTLITGNPTNNSGAVPDAVGGLESSTAVCDASSNLALYSNQIRYYNASNTSFPILNGGSGGSSVDGCVFVPDPANPSTQFYLFLANDKSGGASLGINYYKLSKAGAVLSGPVNLANNTQVDESICAGSDGSGGYWIVSHSFNSTLGQYYIWHVTSSGVSSASIQTPSASATNFGGLGSIKINRCQDKIAYAGSASLQVLNWDRTTGTIGSTIFHSSSAFTTAAYGVEFSPNGNMVYYTDLTAPFLKQLNITNPASPVITTISSSSSNPGLYNWIGNLQLGPDDKIYVVNCSAPTTSAVYIGIINSPDGAAFACSYNSMAYTLKSASATFYPSIGLGIANEGWMSPQTPAITVADGNTCSKVIHTIDFKTYFNSSISVNNSSVEWSFDGGATWTTPGSADATGSVNPYTHDYGGTASATVKVKFKDQACNNYQWSANVSVSTNCPAPVEIIQFDAKKINTAVLLNWYTEKEINNSYFDIQRSEDGINFTSIGKVTGRGNSSTSIHYSFEDSSPLAGINYYRLVQYDFNDSNHTSDIISINNTNGIQLEIYPNPSKEEFYLNVYSNEDVSLLLTDILGREIYKIEAGADRTFSLGKNLPTSTYLLRLITNSEVKVVKLYKE